MPWELNVLHLDTTTTRARICFLEIRIMIICDTHTHQSYCFIFIHSQALHSVVGIYFIIAGFILVGIWFVRTGHLTSIHSSSSSYLFLFPIISHNLSCPIMLYVSCLVYMHFEVFPKKDYKIQKRKKISNHFMFISILLPNRTSREAHSSRACALIW